MSFPLNQDVLICVLAIALMPSSLFASERSQSLGTESQLFRADAIRAFSLLKLKPVEDDLALTELQQRAISRLDSVFSGELKNALFRVASAKSDERRKRQAEMREAIAKHVEVAREFVDGELSDTQRGRLKQIYWQQLGPGVFRDKEVFSQLGLTGEQLISFAQLQAELRREQLKLIEEQKKKDAQSASGKDVKPGFKVRKPSADFNRKSVERFKELLTQRQRESLATLLGAPLAIEVKHMAGLEWGGGHSTPEGSEKTD